jgi:hypothetical protein
MASSVAKYLNHEIGGAVNDLRVIAEIGCGVYEPSESDAPNDAIQVSVKRILELCDDIERTQTSGRLALFECYIAA